MWIDDNADWNMIAIQRWVSRNKVMIWECTMLWELNNKALATRLIYCYNV